MEKTWTEDQISNQKRLVEEAKDNRLYYERGRLDCMLGSVIAPRDISSIEKLQWEEGWRHELLDIPRPY